MYHGGAFKVLASLLSETTRVCQCQEPKFWSRRSKSVDKREEHDVHIFVSLTMFDRNVQTNLAVACQNLVGYK